MSRDLWGATYVREQQRELYGRVKNKVGFVRPKRLTVSCVECRKCELMQVGVTVYEPKQLCCTTYSFLSDLLYGGGKHVAETPPHC